MWVLFSAPAFAQATPIIFERQDITIQPAPPPPAKDGEATILRDSSSFNVEVRSQDALQLEYIHTLNTLTDNGGVMIVLAAPSVVPMPAMQVFTPVDAIFVAEDGTILQIFPGLTLGEQTQDVYPNEPAKALLFLKAGSAQAKIIRPHDLVVGNMFVPPTAVMQ